MNRAKGNTMRHTQVEILRSNRILQQDVALPTLNRADISDEVACLDSFVVSGDCGHLEKRESKLSLEALEQTLQLKLTQLHCHKDDLIQYFGLGASTDWGIRTEHPSHLMNVIARQYSFLTSTGAQRQDF